MATFKTILFWLKEIAVGSNTKLKVLSCDQHGICSINLRKLVFFEMFKFSKQFFYIWRTYSLLFP
jgi:hypothetical protein